MALTEKVLIESKTMESASTIQYTSGTSSKVIIDKFTAHNYTGSDATITVNLVASGAAVSTSNQIVSETITAGETYEFPELVGHVLTPSQYINTAGTATALTIRSSGREIT